MSVSVYGITHQRIRRDVRVRCDALLLGDLQYLCWLSDWPLSAVEVYQPTGVVLIA